MISNKQEAKIEPGKKYDLVIMLNPPTNSEIKEIKQLLHLQKRKLNIDILDKGNHFELKLMRLEVSQFVDSVDFNIYKLQNYDIVIYIEYYLTLIEPKLQAWHFPKGHLRGIKLVEL